MRRGFDRRAPGGLIALALVLVACNANASPNGLPTISLLSGPRSPGPPSVYPKPRLTSPRGYVVPDFTITPVVTPNKDLRLGAVVKLGLIIRNFGPTHQNISAYVSTSNSEAIFRIPRTKGVLGDGWLCSTRPPNTELCGDGGAAWYPVTVRKGETKVLAVNAILSDFRCPGGGDFTWDFGVGITGPVKRGAASYNVMAWFQNDASDYAEYLISKGRAQTPGAPTCKPDSIDVKDYE